MKPANNYIDELAKNAFPEKLASSDDAALWDSIDKTMKLKKFFIFSVKNFNIYYSVLLILIMVSASAYFISKNNLKNDTPAANSATNVIAAKDNISTETENNKAVEIAANTAQADKVNKLQEINSVKNDVSKPLPEIKNETENNLTSRKDSVPKKKKKVKVIKKQYVVVDTIHKKDTVYIKK